MVIGFQNLPKKLPSHPARILSQKTDVRRGIISIIYMNIDQQYNLPIVQVYSSGILFFFVTTVSGTALRVVGQTSLYTTNRFKYFKIHQLIL